MPVAPPSNKSIEPNTVFVQQYSENDPGASNPGMSASQFTISKEQFFDMIERKNLECYEELGKTEGIAAALGADALRGIALSSIEQRITVYGENTLPPQEMATFLALVWEALKDPLLRLLLVAAVVSIILGMTLPPPREDHVDLQKGWIEGTAIIISVTVVVGLSCLSDYQKAKKFAALSADQGHKAVEVFRDGTKMEIDSSEVVVGDVLIVEGGQKLVADGVLIDGQDLCTDESAATGETDVQKKNISKDPFFLSGTEVVEGRGHMVVIGVGVNSFSGKLAMDTRTEFAETPLQEKLAELGGNIGKVGMLLAGILIIGMIIKEIVFIVRDHKPASASAFVNILILGITIVVVAVPEGLPFAVTIALAYSMKAMMADNCLVRILASCETMGAATAICSDKTGTLTKNQMTVVQGYVADESFVIPNLGLEESPGATVWGSGTKLKTKPEILNDLALSISVNSTADRKEENGVLIWTGNKTEHGLLGFVVRLGIDFQALRRSIADVDKRSYPFSSSKKRMTTVVRFPGKRVPIIHVKGASELVLADCEQILESSGEIKTMTPERRTRIMDVITEMARQGNRTIAMAYTEAPWTTSEFPEEEPDEPLIFVSVLGIQDPIREEVPGAITKCTKAGIVVRMVTGDNIITATAIAKKCGIYNGDTDVAMEGLEFRTMFAEAPEMLLQKLPRLRVLARSSPTDKHVLVGLLMCMGDVVGVTGDGTNDAPALKLANVGFAMNSGTDIAKGASSMILIDDCFATICKAVEWGRCVNDNVRKFLQFQLTANVVGVLFTVVGALASPDNEQPLTAVQLLWLNLIMDTLAALALGTERSNPKSLDGLPTYKSGPIITKRMWLFIGWTSAIMLGIQFALLYKGHVIFQCFNHGDCGSPYGTDENGYCRLGKEHSTILFNCFIWLQIFNEVNARSLYGEFNIFDGLWSRSRIFLYVLVIVCGFQIFAVEVAGSFMDTVGLNWWQWLGCVAIGALYLPLGLLVNFVSVKPYVPPPFNAEEAMKIVSSSEKYAELRVTDKAKETTEGANDQNAPSVPQFASVGAEPISPVEKMAVSTPPTTQDIPNQVNRPTSATGINRPSTSTPPSNVNQGTSLPTSSSAASEDMTAVEELNRTEPVLPLRRSSSMIVSPPILLKQQLNKYNSMRLVGKKTDGSQSSRGALPSGRNSSRGKPGEDEDFEEGEPTSSMPKPLKKKTSIRRHHADPALNALRRGSMRALTPEERAREEQERLLQEMTVARAVVEESLHRKSSENSQSSAGKFSPQGSGRKRSAHSFRRHGSHNTSNSPVAQDRIQASSTTVVQAASSNDSDSSD